MFPGRSWSTAPLAGVGLLYGPMLTANQFALVVLAVMTALAVYTQPACKHE